MKKQKTRKMAGMVQGLASLSSLRPTLRRRSLQEAPSLMNKSRGVRVRQK